ncbi:hypothetical protein CSV75_11375 [Sporosarcina sp. P18a]|uniref:hypothetical protein n=1 Tax=Sporosarcina sp. P18a TaxID=2048259 RepID=UPI000C16B8D0|nr:hypothetical protein [Sporosarcina sp. P18a]PIC79781.1 hypothetical protein CSV75_11375 [Sporosarcina sp. P18a]
MFWLKRDRNSSLNFQQLSLIRITPVAFLGGYRFIKMENSIYYINQKKGCVNSMNNCPNPGPQQNWIHQPSNTYLVLGDYNASYDIFPYEVAQETEIVIKGQYPYARYFSFNIAGEFNLSVTSVVDRQLLPDPGSTNPFLPGANWNAKNRNYTLKIRFTAPPDGSSHFVPSAGNNIIYAGTLANGVPNRRGFIIYRVYVPSIGYDTTGGVGLPIITYCPVKKDHRHHPHPSNPANNYSAGQFCPTNLQQHNYPNDVNFEDYFNTTTYDNNISRNRDNGKYAPFCELNWSTLGELSQLFQPEGNTTYIISDQIQRNSVQLLYLRWKAPTVPDTYHNMGIVGDENMRYWSMSFITPGGLLGLYTISDFQTIIDKKGYVNLVISFGAPRPSSVTSENGFTWVDASQLPRVPLFLFYRNNQASESFPYTAKDLPPGVKVPPNVMGKYYPCGNYVNPDYFNSCCWEHDYTNSCCDNGREENK